MRIGADLVRGIPVGGHTVRTHDDLPDDARAHEIPGHVVGDEGHAYVIFQELPGRQARPLQIRTRFTGVHLDAFAFLHGGANDAERGSVAARGEGPGVAVRHYDIAVFEKARTVFAYLPVIFTSPSNYGPPPPPGFA